jgi:hypothetical protein
MYNRSWQKREEEGDLLLMDRIYFCIFSKVMDRQNRNSCDRG